MKSKKAIIQFILAFGLSAFTAECTFAEGWLNNPMSAHSLGKNAKTYRPSETLVWKSDETLTPKDWIRFHNKNFSISFPKCFSVEAEGADEDVFKPEETPGILLTKTKQCPTSSAKKYPDSASIGVDIYAKSLVSVGGDNNLLIQKVIFLGYPGKQYISIIDDALPSGDTKPKIQWSVYFECNEKVMGLVFSALRGQPAIDFINAGKYEFPREYKEIISSFECTKPKK